MLDPICNRELTAEMLEADLALLEKQLRITRSEDIAERLERCIDVRRRMLAEAEKGE